MPVSSPALLEICVDCMASVEACAAAMVPRIELCAGLVEGGTTPSVGFLRAARAAYRGRIMMMIRPRAGDFVFSAAECRIMEEDIRVARDLGADGVVFGCLRPDGNIDEAAAEKLVATAAGMDMTFHRAFDVSRDLLRSLEGLIRLGIPRVLTSGGQASVEAGLHAIAALQTQADGRITLLAGGGLRHDLVAPLRRVGVQEFHLSARSSFPSPMEYRRPDIPMGAPAVPGEYERRAADPEILRAMLAELK
jgi:copper homeostasis protein